MHISPKSWLHKIAYLAKKDVICICTDTMNPTLLSRKRSISATCRARSPCPSCSKKAIAVSKPQRAAHRVTFVLSSSLSACPISARIPSMLCSGVVHSLMNSRIWLSLTSSQALYSCWLLGMPAPLLLGYFLRAVGRARYSGLMLSVNTLLQRECLIFVRW